MYHSRRKRGKRGRIQLFLNEEKRKRDRISLTANGSIPTIRIGEFEHQEPVRALMGENWIRPLIFGPLILRVFLGTGTVPERMVALLIDTLHLHRLRRAREGQLDAMHP